MKQGLNKIENPFQTVMSQFEHTHTVLMKFNIFFNTHSSHLSCDFHQTAPSRTECGNDKNFKIVTGLFEYE